MTSPQWPTASSLRPLGSGDALERKRLLKALSAELLEGKAPLVEQTDAPKHLPPVLAALSPLFGHAKEKVRELALSLFVRLSGHAQLAGFDFLPYLPPVAKALAAAYSQGAPPSPYREPAEEIRLLLLRLCCGLLGHASLPEDGARPAEEGSTSELTQEYLSLAGSCLRALPDPFPEAKREACLLLSRLFKKGPAALRMKGGELCGALAANVQHQHSKTRQMTVKALAMVATAAGGPDDPKKLMGDTVLPALQKLSFDPIPTVRRALVAAASRFLALSLLPPTPDEPTPSPFSPFSPPLLSLVLSCVGDETGEVAACAKAAVGCLASLPRPSSPPPPPGSPAPEAALVTRFLPDLLPPLLADASHWTLSQRSQALSTLTTAVSLSVPGASSPLPDHADVLLTCLAGAATDDEEAVASAARGCARALAAKLSLCPAPAPASPPLFAALLPRIDGSLSGFGTPEKLAANLTLLACFLREYGPAALLPAAAPIAEAAASGPILESGDRDVYAALLDVLSSYCGAFSSLPAAVGGSAAPLARAAVFLLGADVNFDLREDAEELVDDIARLAGASRYAEPCRSPPRAKERSHERAGGQLGI
jgi:hypothetical protein